MYKWFLAWRYLHTKLIAFFGIAGVMFCVGMVLVVMSVMGGFLDTVRERSRGLHSELVLEGSTLQGFPYYEEFGEYLRAHHPDIVRTATPAIYTYGIFRIPATTYTKPARVLGIRLKEYVRVNHFGEGLHYNHFYPGSTSLALQRMPVVGVDDQGHLRLPEDLEAAAKRWRESESDPEAINAYDRGPFDTSPFPYITSPVPGARVFAAGLGEPRYEGPAFDGIIVGCDLINYRRPDGGFERQIARGAPMALTLMPLSPSGNVTGEPPIRLPLRYADDSRTGIYEIDSLCVYVDFDMLQHKLAMDPQSLVEGGMSKPRANQLLIGLQEGVDLDEACNQVTLAWHGFQASLGPGVTEADAQAVAFVAVYTWEDLQRPFIAAVEKEKVLVTILFALISLVAIVLVGCIFYMIVEKKTRDIGILKSLGASGSGIATLFILYAGAVGIVGAVLGTVLGTAFVWYINDLQDWLAGMNPDLRMWTADVYSFDQIPNIVKLGDAAWIAIIAVLASIVGSLIPATIAGRVWPVRALRYE